jgi:hypothetical protein
VLTPRDLLDNLKSQLKELRQIYDEFPEGFYLELLEANNFNIKATRKCLTDRGVAMIEKFPIIDAALGADAECPVCGEDMTSSNAVHAGCGHFVCTDCLPGQISAYINQGPVKKSIKCIAKTCQYTYGLSTIQKFSP